VEKKYSKIQQETIVGSWRLTGLGLLNQINQNDHMILEENALVLEDNQMMETEEESLDNLFA